MKEPSSLIPFKKNAASLTVAEAPPVLDYGVENQEDGKSQFLEYWRSVRKHLWLIIGMVLLGTLLASVYAARLPDEYEAGARVQVDMESNPLQGVASKGQIFVNNPTNDPVYFTTQMQILNSQSLLRRVAKSLNLENDKTLAEQPKETASTWQLVLRMFGLSKRPAMPTADPEQDRLGAEAVAPASPNEDLAEAKRLAPYVGFLNSGLKVEPVRDSRMGFARETRLIDIKFQHTNPRVAARVVNAIADTYVKANEEKKNRASDRTSADLQKRIAEVQSAIREGEQKKLNYAREKGFVSLTGEENTVAERLSGLNQQLLLAENARKEAEAAFKAHQAEGAIEAKVDTGDKQSADSQTNQQISDSEAKLTLLRQKRAELLEEYTEEWPEVKQVEGQIAIVEQDIKNLRARAGNLRGRAITSIKKNYEVAFQQALQKEQQLRAAYNEQFNKAQVQNQSAINYKIIDQELETNKTLLNGLLERVKEYNVGQDVTPNNITVTDYALTSDAPVGPRRMRSVVTALMLSLLMGVGLALLLEYFNDTVRSPEDVERGLRLPALGVIPGLDGGSRRRLLPGKAALQKRDGGGNELIINSENKRSPLAEAYRQLRTSVLLSTAGHAPKSLLITSSVPSEGKTTTAVNLAASLAQTGASVLLIDADMRRPRLHNVFGLQNRNGLSTVLARSGSEAEMLAMVQQHQVSNLYVLTSGPVPPNPAELLGSEQMRRMMKVFTDTFTHVVIDTPPTASFTDSVLVSTLVDGVLLVVHGGRSSRHVVRRTKQILQDVGAKIFGVVLNNVDVKSHDYYYYYQQYYYKSYYGGDKDEVAEEDED
jgi:capsular exopolysaccharide synthesis family protein